MKNRLANMLKEAKKKEKQGDVDGARSVLKSIISVYPGNKTAKAELIRLQGAQAKQERRRQPSSDDIGKVTHIYNSGDFEKAERHARALLTNYPTSFILWFIASAAAKKLGKNADALEGFKRVVELNPEFVDAHNNLGILAYEDGNIMGAISHYDRALKLNPSHVNTLINKGKALTKNNEYDAAVKFLEKAYALDPEDSKLCLELGEVFHEIRELPKAIAFLQKSLELDPSNASSECFIYHLQRLICDWRQTEIWERRCPDLGVTTDAVATFPMLSLEDNIERQFKRSKNWADKSYRHIAPLEVSAAGQSSSRIRIGYYSADFRNFPGMILMSEMLARHDREKFEVFAFSYGPKKEDDMTSRIRKSVDHFINIHDLSDLEIAEMSRDHNIDIAIHRNGYTKHHRTSIFARRVAPVQVNFLGYPGTLGADFIDYIVADETVLPHDQKKFYSERVIYLPDTYQPNDDTRAIPDLPITHKHVGLPENSIVFCCFNNSYKLGPAEFDIWMRIMHKIESSVLWLLESNKWVKDNLIYEAAKRGINADRLIFAPKIVHAEHLARHKFADIFLDTFNYNAHTTASDALWAGVPVVTKMGEQFSARVSASLLKAVGLPELITTTTEDYENLILELATDKERLDALKGKLSKNKRTYPLFDTDRYTRNFEAGLMQAHDISVNGGSPEDIWVSSDEQHAI